MTTNAQTAMILERAQVIAVVGASTHAHKPSHTVPADLIRAGYQVIPVHPSAPEIFGVRAYPRLADIPVPVDIVNVFRPPAEVADITRQAAAIGAPVVWVQEGITSAEAAQVARDEDLTYLEDNCIGVAVRRFGRDGHAQK